MLEQEPACVKGIAQQKYEHVLQRKTVRRNYEGDLQNTDQNSVWCGLTAGGMEKGVCGTEVKENIRLLINTYQ